MNIHIIYYIYMCVCVYSVRIYWFIRPFTKRSPNMDHRFATDSAPHGELRAFSLPKDHQELPETAEANLFLRILG